MSENLEDNEPRIIPPALPAWHAPCPAIRKNPRCLLQVPPLPCVRHLAVAPPGLAA